MLAGNVLLQSKIQAVLLRRGRKGPDILIRDLDIRNAGVVDVYKRQPRSNALDHSGP